MLTSVWNDTVTTQLNDVCDLTSYICQWSRNLSVDGLEKFPLADIKK